MILNKQSSGRLPCTMPRGLQADSKAVGRASTTCAAHPLAGLITGLLIPLLAVGASPYDTNMIAEDPDLALPAYLHELFGGFRMHSNGGFGLEGTESQAAFVMGARRASDGLQMRALCGLIINGELASTERQALEAACEEHFLRTIQKLSQPQEPGPYRAAGPSEITWRDYRVTLATSDVAFILEGRYAHLQSFTPCLWLNGCCPLNGALYLSSCREPTTIEWQAIDHCQLRGLSCGTPAYLACLQAQGVQVGCEMQPDGSRLCK